MAIFSYIVTHDQGFSPNPYYGVCTLACCKPAIRRVAKMGDWVVGLSPKKDEHRLIYAMQVDEVLTFGQYWAAKRFHAKRPDFATLEGSLGDNIYKPVKEPEGGGFRQQRSRHSRVGTAFPPGDYRRFSDQERDDTKTTDLNGKHVLVAKAFVYFGLGKSGSLSKDWDYWRRALAVGRNHRTIKDPETIKGWEKFIAGRLNGLINSPIGPHSAATCGKLARVKAAPCKPCPSGLISKE